MSNENDFGRPVLWRHHYAGVLLGWVKKSDIPGHLGFDGVRIRVWRGDRIDCASLAKVGPLENDEITDRVTRDVALEGSVEIYDTTHDHVREGIRLSCK